MQKGATQRRQARRARRAAREQGRRRTLPYIEWPAARLGWRLKGQPPRTWRRPHGDNRRPGHSGIELAQGQGNRIEVRRAPAGGGNRPSAKRREQGGLDPYLVHATRPKPWVTRRRNRQRNRIARASRKVNR